MLQVLLLSRAILPPVAPRTQDRNWLRLLFAIASCGGAASAFVLLLLFLILPLVAIEVLQILRCHLVDRHLEAFGGFFRLGR